MKNAISKIKSERMRITILLLLFMLCAMILGFTAIGIISLSKKLDMPLPYTQADLVYGNIIDTIAKTDHAVTAQHLL